MALILMNLTAVSVGEGDVPPAIRRFVANWNATLRRNSVYDQQLAIDSPESIDKTIQYWLVHFLAHGHREPGIETMPGSNLLEYVKFHWTQAPVQLNEPLRGTPISYERAWTPAVSVEAILKELDK